MDIVSSLQTLGLSPKEAAVYAALLHVKKGTAQSISEAAGIKRPTTYLVLESLLQKKIIACTKFRNVKDYRALPLEHLKNYIQKQKKSIKDALPKMQKLYDHRAYKVRLRIYNNLSSLKTLLEKSLREKSVMHIIGDEEQFKARLGAYWEFYVKRAEQLGTSPKFKKYDGVATLLVWKDKTAFVRFGDNPQVFAFKNKSLHALYQDLWNKY